MSNLEKVNDTKAFEVSHQQRVQVPSILAWIQDPARRQLCKDLHAKGASDLEYEHLLVVSTNTQLDPFKRQIYLVPRWDSKLGRNVYTPQTSIDGFRLIAERTGKYIGQLGPYWCGPDGKWVDVWLEKGSPAAAKVGVLHADFKEPLWAVARFDAYAQTTSKGDLTVMWKKMGDVMIAKCAESLAIRKAFPDQTAGLYTSEEMAQSEPQAQQVNPIKQIRDVEAAQSSDPGNYVMQKGIFKGKSLYEIGAVELAPYFDQIQESFEQTGKTPTKSEAEFLECAKAFIAREKASMGLDLESMEADYNAEWEK